MSEADAAVVDQGGVWDKECPLCLDPLPPSWDINRLIATACCGKYICIDCHDKKNDVLDRAFAEGSYGRGEDQLNSCCPFCRTKKPDPNYVAKLMEQKYINGCLPLNLYNLLGVCYLEGTRGVAQDMEKGFDVLMRGAEKGEPRCQNNVGAGYQKGSHLPKSLEEARRWFLAAAEQGHAGAEFNLALMSKDEGNDAEYLRYLKGSASKGYDNACYLLGLAHYQGLHGAQQSTEETIRVLTPAAERGHTISMTLLGFALIYTVPARRHSDDPSFTMGMHFLRRAAEAGDQQSISKLEELEKWANRKCFRCNKEAPPEKAFLRCSRCRAAWYCSKDCQALHWRAKGGHKQCCIKWCPQKERERNASRLQESSTLQDAVERFVSN